MSNGSGTASSADATDRCLVVPPATTVTGATGASSSRTAATWSGGAATTITPTAEHAATRRTACTSSGSPRSRRNALGAPAPRRTPEPAAGTRTATSPRRSSCEVTSRSWCCLSQVAAGSRLGEHLVEEHLRLVLGALLGERDLADEDIPGLGEHAL